MQFQCDIDLGFYFIVLSTYCLWREKLLNPELLALSLVWLAIIDLSDHFSSFFIVLKYIRCLLFTFDVQYVDDEMVL